MPIGSWVRLAYIGNYFHMDDIPSVTALHDGARRPIGSWVRLAYIGDYSPMDDIPPVTALHDGARNQQVTRARNLQLTNTNWVLG